MPTSWRSATSGPDFSMFSSELNGSRVEPEYANVSRTISVSRAFWIESATPAESTEGISSSDGARGGFRVLDLALAFLSTTGGLISSARTESTQVAKRTCARESAARRAFRRLSVRTRKAAARTSASLAFLFPRNGRLSSWEHPDTARTARRARPKALRATGPSFLGRRLHVGADLKAGLEQRAGAVTERLGRGGIGRSDREVVRHDDALKAGHIRHELPDLIVLPDHGHVVGIGVERSRAGLDRLRHHLR